MDLILKIDTVEKIKSEDFRKNYLIPQQPLLIKNLTRETAAANEWSIEYFIETAGNITVDIFDNSNKNNSSAFTRPDLQMKFGDYLHIISQNKKTDLRIFLFNLFKVKPELRKKFPCPDIFKGILGKIGFMFFGGKNVTVRMHQDIDMSNVLLTQFEGRKRVLLFSPEYSSLLYKLPLNTYTLINPDKPDYDEFPALKYVKGYEIIMEPGDSLFMPSGYWHYMTYLDAGFAVSYRKMAQSWNKKMEGLLNLAIYLPLDKFMNFISGEAWVKYKIEVAHSRANKRMEEIKNSQAVFEQGVVPVEI
jgi:hypothetical protein